MEVFEAIHSRRSVREFKDIPVLKETIERLIDAANWAPSNCNLQGWRFVVVDSRELRQRMVDYGASPVINSAPCGILVCYDHRSTNVEYDDWLQSASAAVQNILLSAHSLGLGACWICHLPRQGVLKRLFKIPSFFSPVAYLALGYSSDKVKMVERKADISKIYDYNRFPRILPVNPQSRFIFFKRMAVRCYYALPIFIKRRINRTIHRLFIKRYE